MLISVRQFSVALAVTFYFYSVSYAAQTADYDLAAYTADEAYAVGYVMRAQFKEESARAYLKYAADKGNADAAYLYASDITDVNRAATENDETPDEAKSYFLQAATAGHLDAMKYLYTDGSWLRGDIRLKWKRQYHDGVIELAATEPGKASYDLAEYYYDTDEDHYNYYLETSVEYDYPYAVLATVIGIDEIKTHHRNPEMDSGDIDDIHGIAEKGFIPAIRLCIEYYEHEGDYENALHWRLKAVELGDLTSLAVAAKIYAGQIPGYGFVKKDLSKSYAYADVYLDNAGKSKFVNVFKMMEDLHTDLIDNMTATQLKEAATLTATYEKNMTFYSFDAYWDN